MALMLNLAVKRVAAAETPSLQPLLLALPWQLSVASKPGLVRFLVPSSSTSIYIHWFL